jgi:hypothetical protein
VRATTTWRLPQAGWQFGNVQSGETHGDAAQYGKLDANNFPDLASRFYPNNCTR